MTPTPLAIFGDDAAFHHVGLAVRSIAESIGAGAEIVRDDTQRVSVAFVDLNGICVELIEPAADDSPITARLAAGQPLVHLCFEVADLAKRDRGRTCRGLPQARPPGAGTRVPQPADCLGL